MKAKLQAVIRDWARRNGLIELPAHITDDEITELATLIEGVILDYYAKVLKDPQNG
jgi:hypothetical protein